MSIVIEFFKKLGKEKEIIGFDFDQKIYLEFNTEKGAKFL